MGHVSEMTETETLNSNLQPKFRSSQGTDGDASARSGWRGHTYEHRKDRGCAAWDATGFA